MDFSTVLNKCEPHQRTIIHLDMDYFYAQVEEIRNPKLRTQPLGIQQKNIVVTCNYIAREMGVKKLMLIAEAKKLCPTLLLVNGEDLTPYRKMSSSIHDLLLDYTPTVEKLGFDENFMDVSALVEQLLMQADDTTSYSGELIPNRSTTVQQQGMSQKQLASITEKFRLSQESGSTSEFEIEGYIHPAGGSLFDCSCGCAQRLAIGTKIAKEIRDDLNARLGITCCAGVSYNKLLAKLVGSLNKPNKQTVLVSTYPEQFMRDLKELNRITGIGQKTQSLLLESNIMNVEDLQLCDMDFLKKKCGFETATKLKDLSFGRDTSAVRPSGKPKSIGLEDSCRPISLRAEVEERFRMLLMRLMEQVAEDGRIPISIKVILRKFDNQKKTSHRETKQANILPSLFKTLNNSGGGSKVVLVDGSQEKLLKIIMRLFERVVDLTKPFNITLIGLAFSKFQQRKAGSSSIANYLIKKADLEVQSITSLTNTVESASRPSVIPPTLATTTPTITTAEGVQSNDEAFRSSPTTFQPSDQFYRRRTMAASPIPMLTDNGSESGATNSDFSDFSETEVEPSPKKSRISQLMAGKRRCFGSTAIYNNETAEVASPSKLRVCDLRLNSRDSEKDFQLSPNATTPTTTAPNNPLNCTEVGTSQITINSSADAMNIRARQQQLSEASFTPLMPMDDVGSTTVRQLSNSISPMDESGITPIIQLPNSTTITGNLSNIPCPAGVDPQIFNELPIEVQNELISSWRSSLAAAAVAVVNDVAHPISMENISTSNHTNHQNNSHQTAKAGGAAANSTQKNTLYRYFLRNK